MPAAQRELMLFHPTPTDNWLLYDAYTTAVGAPVPTNRNAEGTGLETFTQVDGNFSISGGRLVFPAQATAVWGDEGFYATQQNGAAFPRVLGRTFFFSVIVTSGSALTFSWHTSTALGTAADSNTTASMIHEGTTFRVLDGAALIGSAANWTLNAAGVEEQFAMVLRNTGCYIFRRAAGTWMLVWSGNIGTTTPLYPVFKNHSGVGSIDLVRVKDIKTAPFQAEYQLATVNVTTDGQSLGAELLTNGDFATWSGGNPTGYTVGGEVGSDPEVSEVSSGNTHGGGGTGAANFFSTATANAPTLTQSTLLVANGIYEDESDLSARVSGTFLARKDGSTSDVATIFSATTTGIRRAIYRYLDSGAGGLRLQPSGAAPADLTLNNYSHKKITLPTAQVSSADAIHIVEFTLPASPIAGQRFNLLYRTAAAGEELLNGFVAYLQRNDGNTAWDFRLDTAITGAITNRVNVTGVGTPTAIAIVANGINNDCYTLASTTWTKRGSTFSNSVFATATGLNYCYSSGFTFGSLRSYPIWDTRYRRIFEQASDPKWLMFEDFSRSESPITTRAAEIGGQSLTWVQVDGALSAYGSGLVFPAQASPVAGDQGGYSPTFARVGGRALFFSIKNTTVAASGAWVGWTAAAANGAQTGAEHTIGFHTTQLISEGANTTQIVMGTVTNAELIGALVLFATGAAIFLKGNTNYADWTLVWLSRTGSSANLRLAFDNLSNVGAIAWVGVRDLTGIFTSDTALATFNVTADTQSFSAEQLTNGNFAAWSGDNPTGWTVNGESGSDPMVTQVANGGGAGTGAARLYTADTDNIDLSQNSGSLSGSIMEVGLTIDTIVADGISFRIGGSALAAYTTTGVKRNLYRTPSAGLNFIIRRNVGPTDVTVDDATAKIITLPTAQVSVADAIHLLEFTLPVSPVAGQAIHLFYRGTAGEELNNCWDAYLLRNATNSGWDFRLDSISGGTATNRINATGISVDTGIMVSAVGNLHDCWTRNAGAWTKRGGQITNSQGATLTSCNYVYSAGFGFTAFRSYAARLETYAELDRM